MTTVTADGAAGRPALDRRNGPFTSLVFVGLLALGVWFGAQSLYSDVNRCAPTARCACCRPRRWPTCATTCMAWVLTLPAAILLSGSLYWLFSQLF
jgi:phosphate/sulfate permease